MTRKTAPTWMPLLLAAFTLVASPSILADTIPARIPHFHQEIAATYTEADGLPSNDIRAIAIATDGSPVARTAHGVASFKDGAWTAADSDAFPAGPDMKKLPKEAGKINQIATAADGQVYVACEHGLYSAKSGGAPYEIEIVEPHGRVWAKTPILGVAVSSDGALWAVSENGVATTTDEKTWTFYTGREGLPYNQFTCAAAGGDGAIWFGTTLGAIRFDGKTWSYRQGKRWLPHDEVRGMAVDQAGNAWFATKSGVGTIERRKMTLAEKAAYYEDEIESGMLRTEYGYLSEAGLKTPGDKSELHLSDSDNDGLWTSMYGAGECFAYAATKDPKAKARATRAFEALRFLQKVTQGGEHSPPHGYVARTILPTDGPDPNVGRIERDRKSRDEGDRLWKVYEPRWPTSADGKWFWKSDTSSDELDGHYFFYPLYHDLVADTEEEKNRVREVVRDLTDHMIEHDFCLMDHDGTCTRWGVFGPTSLNYDRDWFIERGLNSLSMLAYLAVAEHVTGDPKYGEVANKLAYEHGYAANMMYTKVHFGIGSGNHSDDEMAVMSFYNLLRYSKNEDLKQRARYGFYQYHALEHIEMNPFFNFAYAAFGIGQLADTPFGKFPIDPWEGWLTDAVATLTNFPLDRIDWGHKNSHRLDIVPLHKFQGSDLYAPDLRKRGHLVNGKVLPVAERYFHHWNTDPFNLDYGGNGGSLGSGTVFLLPYYMGLYHGFISEAPATQ